jgi:hypothetical protein
MKEGQFQIKDQMQDNWESNKTRAMSKHYDSKGHSLVPIELGNITEHLV